MQPALCRYSPALLLRMGIGDAASLREHGIAVIADRPGVGANLQNHPALYLATNLTRTGRQARAVKHWGMNALRYSSGFAGEEADMMMFIINKTSWHAIGRRTASLGVSVYRSHSRGSVSLASAERRAEPRIRMNLLSDERDLARLTAAVRLAYRTLRDPTVAALREDIFASPSGEFIRRLHAPTKRNAILAAGVAAAMSVSRRFRALVAARVGSDIAPIVDDDGALRGFVSREGDSALSFRRHMPDGRARRQNRR